MKRGTRKERTRRPVQRSEAETREMHKKGGRKEEGQDVKYTARREAPERRAGVRRGCRA